MSKLVAIIPCQSEVYGQCGRGYLLAGAACRERPQHPGAAGDGARLASRLTRLATLWWSQSDPRFHPSLAVGVDLPCRNSLLCAMPPHVSPACPCAGGHSRGENSEAGAAGAAEGLEDRHAASKAAAVRVERRQKQLQKSLCTT
eukprot:6199833-Pleurochrysis_carterae.AAC.5